MKNKKKAAGSKRSEKFYMDTVIFKVEDTLFKVPKAYFVENSVLFRDMFGLPQSSETSNAEGTSDDHPLVLEDVKAADFERLLEYMYPKPEHNIRYHIHTPSPPSSDDENEGPDTKNQNALSLLKLTRRWMFQGLHAELVKELSGDGTMSPMEKVLAGKEHHIPEWLRKGYIELVRRWESLTVEETKMLDVEDAVRIFQLRESRHDFFHHLPGQEPSVEVRLLNVFREELLSVEKDYLAFYNSGD